MKVVLIEPGYIKGNHPPLGLLHIATNLDIAGHKVRIKNYAEKEITEKLVKYDIKDAGVVGVRVISGPAISRVMKISRIAKSLGKPVLWGGPHNYAFPRLSFKTGVVDYLARGEGEKITVEFCDRLEKGKSMKGCAGIWYKENGKIMGNPEAPILDLNALPIPNWKLADKDAFTRCVQKRSATLIESQRSCMNRCSFCSVFKILGKYRARRIDLVIDEINLIKECLPKVNALRFTDCTFSRDRKRTMALLDALKKEKYDMGFWCGSRVDAVDRELLRKMHSVGFSEIDFGVESGSQRILNILRKGVKVQQIIDGFRACNKENVLPLAFLIFANPTETYYDIWQTIKVCGKIKASYYRAGFLKPMPDTDIYSLCIKHGFVPPKTLEEWCDKVFREEKVTYNFSKVPTPVLYLVKFLFDNYTNISHIKKMVKERDFNLMTKEAKRKLRNLLFERKVIEGDFAKLKKGET